MAFSFLVLIFIEILAHKNYFEWITQLHIKLFTKKKLSNLSKN